jgi:hypothetical protein
MKKTILSIIIATTLLLTVTALRAKTQSIVLGFNPSIQDVNVGSMVDVALQISGLGNSMAPSLSSFDLNVNFDPAILSYSNTAFGDPALGDQLDIFDWGGNPTSSILTGAGTLNLFEVSFDTPAEIDANQAADFALVILTFKALAPGNSALGLWINSLADANGDSLSASIEGGNITVVPIPATVWLMGSALFGLLGWSGRKKSQYSF